MKQGKVPVTFWADEDFYDEPAATGAVSWAPRESGHSQTGINELNAIVGDDHGFETVKPLRLFEADHPALVSPRRASGLIRSPARGRPATPSSTSTPRPARSAASS